MRLRVKQTVRLRLTMSYGGLFLACGAALLAMTYLLVHQVVDSSNFAVTGKDGTVSTYSGSSSAPGGHKAPGGQNFVVNDGKGVARTVPLKQAAEQQRQVVTATNALKNAVFRQLLTQSGIALAVMAVLSI